jgi:hypothetical protein
MKLPGVAVPQGLLEVQTRHFVSASYPDGPIIENATDTLGGSSSSGGEIALSEFVVNCSYMMTVLSEL